MDNVKAGFDNISEAIETQHQLKKLLQTEGINLRKFSPMEDVEVPLNFVHNGD